jgi:hypothetical protein
MLKSYLAIYNNVYNNIDRNKRDKVCDMFSAASTPHTHYLSNDFAKDLGI